MARVRIILENNNGQLLTATAEQLYSLEGPCDTLDSIEDAVEAWRKKALPDIAKTLLIKAQEDAIAKKNRS